ncbi:MAG: hypothetical protein HY645_11705 [Acidobacteria bacterium]|nr:hypothetical protein [Acidobacteriota bacterium]
MNTPVISKIFFTVTFPPAVGVFTHVSSAKLYSLARKQLSDLEIIETIEHLLKCQRCFENYRWVRASIL